MIDRELKTINEADLLKLIGDPVLEGKTIEYKAELAISTDEQKRKFFASVASFANASGGDIIFGIAAADGKPSSLSPLVSFNPDADVLRLRDLIRAHIEPTISGFDFRAVELTGGGHALVLRIPKTWVGAHMVTYNHDFRFYTRDLAGRRLMDAPEIRSAFTLAETTIEKVNRFRLERLGNIVAGETPVHLQHNSAIALHLVPLRSFDPNFTAELNLLRSNPARLPPLYSGGWNSGEDFEGFFTYSPSDDEATQYCYAFRNGRIEAVEGSLLRPRPKDGEEYKVIPSIAYEKELLKGVPVLLQAMKLIGVDAPLILLLSLLGVRGYWMTVGPEYDWHGARSINRDQLLLPGVMIETLDLETNGRTTPNNIFDIMRPLFDQIWNACGYPRSINFDDNGDWKPPR
ncbi:MAG: hypothetical protein QOG67_98 [Verrucomicrobiota bacterium]|jgi:hypothetical protein